MACLLTSGRALPCKSSVGGLKAVYFADYGTLGDVTIVAGEITAVAGTPDFFKYDIKGSSSLETAITSSRENGTTFYTQTLNLTLTTLDKATQEEIKLLATVSRPHVAIEDYNGNFFLVRIRTRNRGNWRYNCIWCCNGRCFIWIYFNVGSDGEHLQLTLQFQLLLLQMKVLHK